MSQSLNLKHLVSQSRANEPQIHLYQHVSLPLHDEHGWNDDDGVARDEKKAVASDVWSSSRPCCEMDSKGETGKIIETV